LPRPIYSNIQATRYKYISDTQLISPPPPKVGQFMSALL